jgi:ABC-type transport system substrate-binding protein
MRKFLVWWLASLSLSGASMGARPYILSQPLKERPIPGGTLRLSPFGQQLNLELDPAKDAHVFLMQQLYDGLVRLDKDLNPTPALAEYWIISESGRRYTFYLRRGVRFHDGREMTAADVAYSFRRLVDPQVNSPYAANFLGRVTGAQEFWDGKVPEVSGFRTRGKYVFEIQWVDPYVSALYLLSMSYTKILPREPLLAQGRDFFRKPVGTGPFRFGYWLRNPRLDIVGIRLERNDDYYDTKAFLDAVEFSPFYTFDDFRHRDVDIYPFVSRRLADMDCQIREDGALTVVLLGMSCHLEPLNRPEVRRALAAGLDRRTLAKVSYTNESVPEPTDNFIPAKLKGFLPLAGDWDYDPQGAGRLLAAAGFPADRDFPPLTLFTSRAAPELGQKVYRELKGELQALGISLSHREYGSLREVRAYRKPYLVLIEWRLNFPDPESFVRPLFYSRSDLNAMGYANPKLDATLEEAEAQPSFSQRIGLFQKIERQLRQDLPAVPLFSNELRMALQPYVRGVEISPLGFFYLDLRKVWLDKER